MTDPRVVHCKKEPFDVYVGRPGPWGNPWSSKPSAHAQRVSSREEAIRLHREWFLSQLELCAKAKRELHGKDLGCWCKDRSTTPCHADVILAVANDLPLEPIQEELFA